MVSWAGRTVLVTGASRGIGRATAELFGRAGATVFVNYRRSAEAAQEVAATIDAAGGRAYPVQADLEQPDAIRAMLAEVRARVGHLDVLVANAASTAFKPLLATRAHNVDRTFGVVVRGFLLLAQEAVPLMRDRAASIVALSGLDSLLCFPLHGALGTAKAAIETMVRYLAVELGPVGIRVNAISPGVVETDSARMYMGAAWPEIRARIGRATPLSRVATPEDVARAIRLLCSPDAAWVTGQTLLADGGLTLGAGIPGLLEGLEPSPP